MSKDGIWRRVLTPWACAASAAEVHEPHLHEAWQREGLAFLLEEFRRVGISRVTVVTMPDDPRVPDHESSAALAGLDSMTAAFGRLGLLIRVELADFHRRRIVLLIERGNGFDTTRQLYHECGSQLVGDDSVTLHCILKGNSQY